MSADPAPRILAEAIGTGILVLFGAGSVVAALTLGGGELDYAGLGMVAITFALAIAVAIYTFGNSSGAHLNPAVTVSLATVGRFPWPEVTAIMALAVDRRAPGGWAGLMIGLAVAAAILFIGPVTGGSLNPARTIGPLVVSTIGGGDTFWGTCRRT
jgi:glycerol uptake facilitator protein